MRCGERRGWAPGARPSPSWSMPTRRIPRPARTLRAEGPRVRVAPAAAAAAIAVGTVAALAGATALADAIWAAAVAALLLVLVGQVAAKLAVGRVGVDAIALLAMGGALVLGEYLAGAVIALMLSGGDALEAAAARTAR